MSLCHRYLTFKSKSSLVYTDLVFIFTFMSKIAASIPHKKDDLLSFVDELIRDKNLPTSDEAVREQMKNDLLDRVEDRVNAVILRFLPPEKLGELEEKLNADAPDEEVQAFVREYIPDLDVKVAAALVAFRQTYLGA